MTSVAILIGSSTYDKLPQLPCCQSDVEAVFDLVSATGRFSIVNKLVDNNAAELKRHIREILAPIKEANEILFYFSGHGHSVDGEFYFCSRDFDVRRPNESGLPNNELTALLRESSPGLAVKL